VIPNGSQSGPRLRPGGHGISRNKCSHRRTWEGSAEPAVLADMARAEFR
jgi:hypothetical protein